MKTGSIQIDELWGAVWLLSCPNFSFIGSAAQKSGHFAILAPRIGFWGKYWSNLAWQAVIGVSRRHLERPLFGSIWRFGLKIVYFCGKIAFSCRGDTVQNRDP
jgi:hypothetical protein